MSFTKVWLHLVWATKNRKDYLQTDIRQKVFDHIKSKSLENNIFIDYVNGYTDHIHCLISLGSDQTISKIVQLIKGESSHWINEQKLTKEKFEWQKDYFAVSVSNSVVGKARSYVKNQNEHHRIKTFQEEYDEFMTSHGFQRFDDEPT